MDPINIQTSPTASELLVFSINDQEYKWRPPKAGRILAALRKASGDQLQTSLGLLNAMVFDGLDLDDQDRLDDQMADMDDTDITRLIEGLMEAAVARPTRSPSG